MDNFGQFGNVLPPEQAQALKEALQRRQQGGQVANAASGGNLPQATNPQTTMPMQNAGGNPIPQPAQTQQPVQMTNPETEIILKALSDRLKTISELEKGRPV